MSGGSQGEQSLVLIKPDGIRRRLAGEIISRLERGGFRIVAMRMLRIDNDLASEHYRLHRGKEFYPGLVEYITSGPVVALVLEGDEAVERIRAAIGATDPSEAERGTIRGDLGLDIRQNLVHASDSREAAAREIDLFFPSHPGPVGTS